MAREWIVRIPTGIIGTISGEPVKNYGPFDADTALQLSHKFFGAEVFKLYDKHVSQKDYRPVPDLFEQTKELLKEIQMRAVVNAIELEEAVTALEEIEDMVTNFQNDNGMR